MTERSPEYLADINLAAAIAAEMQLQLASSATDVTVSVTNGRVTLEGRVASQRLRDRAERVACAFDAAGIVNAIEVSGRTPEGFAADRRALG